MTEALSAPTTRRSPSASGPQPLTLTLSSSGGEGIVTALGTRMPGSQAARFDLADPVVVAVGDVEPALAIERDAGGVVELGRGARPAVAAEPRGAGAGHRRDGAASGDLPDAAVVAVGDVEAALAVDHYPGRVVELGARRRPAVAPEAGRAVAGYGGDDPVPEAVAFGQAAPGVTAPALWRARSAPETGASGR